MCDSLHHSVLYCGIFQQLLVVSPIVIVMNNNTGQVIVSATTNNTIHPLPDAPTPCQHYTANVTAFSSEYYSESVVIGQRTTGGVL